MIHLNIYLIVFNSSQLTLPVLLLLCPSWAFFSILGFYFSCPRMLKYLLILLSISISFVKSIICYGILGQTSGYSLNKYFSWWKFCSKGFWQLFLFLLFGVWSGVLSSSGRSNLVTIWDLKFSLSTSGYNVFSLII